MGIKRFSVEDVSQKQRARGETSLEGGNDGA